MCIRDRSKVWIKTIKEIHLACPQVLNQFNCAFKRQSFDTLHRNEQHKRAYISNVAQLLFDACFLIVRGCNLQASRTSEHFLRTLECIPITGHQEIAHRDSTYKGFPTRIR
eukprot:TRINITY_DN24816_c0_g1_i2.p1 TRINITY_DN24816_c0_g1~~TRINITY_DN24816_c0_g1_i2.p1  ORF type:complete len:130 (+),score=1.61 TRINITY_DN24816_c0_g1_i2:60-392(+)